MIHAKRRTLSSLLQRCAAALLGALLLAGGVHAQQPPPRATPPKIVLKLDDLTNQNPNWQKVLDMVNQRGIKASFGIICSSLESGRPAYLKWIKDTKAGGRIEFWCHGFDHREWTENGLHYMEFEGPSYEQQKEHLQRCQRLAREKLGFTFESFGAPFNSTDEKTAQVLRDDVPDFKVWMYGDRQFPVGKTVLARYGDVNIENPLFVPSTARLAAGMAKHATAPYFVIQGHPPQWDAARLAEFEKMLDYLVAQHAEFVTPSELAASLPAPAPGGALPPPVTPRPASTPAASPPAAAKAGVPTGENLLANGDFSAGLDGWTLERLQNTAAEAKVEDADGKHAVHISVPAAAEKRFYVQLSQKSSFALAEGKTYTLSFRAKATPAASVVAVLTPAPGAAAPPPRQDNIRLNEEWTDYSFVLAPTQAQAATRLILSGLAAQAGEYWFANVSVKQNE